MNNQQFGYGGYGVQPGMMGGTQYNTMPVAKMTQILTPEQMKSLQNNAAQFTMAVPPEELLRAQCTHKKDGKIALLDNGDGTVTCQVCGARFQLLDLEPQQVADIANMYVNTLQSIKTYYLDMPEQFVEFFKNIPFVEKTPKLYEIATSNFRQYENANPLQQSNQMYGFQMLGAISNPAYGAGFMGGAPQGYGYPQGQPQGYGYPQGQPQGYGYPQGQPQGYGQAPQGYNPGFGGVPQGSNGFGYNGAGAVYNQQPEQQPQVQANTIVETTKPMNS